MNQPDDGMKPIQCLRENVDLDMLLDMRRQLVTHHEALQEEADRLRLIANSTRLSILWLIARSPKKQLCPCDLADILGMTVSSVSQHLQRMRRGKLIANRREGKTIFYSLLEAGATVANSEKLHEE